MTDPDPSLTHRSDADRNGLGTLLRHLTDLVDGGSEEHYRTLGIPFRPRYTPLLRALGEEILTVSELCERTCVTQGAVSQTLTLMERDGLIRRLPGRDRRQRTVELTDRGRELYPRLVEQWGLRLAAIEHLEAEIRLPLRTALADAIEALGRRSFCERIGDAAKAADLLEENE